MKFQKMELTSEHQFLSFIEQLKNIDCQLRAVARSFGQAPIAHCLLPIAY
jgi:hypothetical protein